MDAWCMFRWLIGPVVDRDGGIICVGVIDCFLIEREIDLVVERIEAALVDVVHDAYW